jgi:hypothetical protein
MARVDQEYQVTEKGQELANRLASTRGVQNMMGNPLMSSMRSNPKRQQAQSKTSPEANEKRIQKIPEKDPNFSNIAPGVPRPLKVRDSSADILGKMYNFMMKQDAIVKKERKNEKKIRQEEVKTKEDRSKELIGLFKFKKRKKFKEEVKKKEKPKEEEKKKEPPKKEAPKPSKEAPKPSETKTPVKPEVKPTAERVPSAPLKAPSTAVKVTTTTAAAGGVGALLMPSESVAAVIDKASNMVGVDKSLMYAMAKQESGFNPNAAAGTSSAKGLYQFIKDTWKNMVSKYGAKYPILRAKGPEDPEANAIAGALFIKENSEYLAKNGIEVNATSIYAAHFLGAGGAKQLLTANPQEIASKILPKPASSNKNIFYDKTGNPRTVQQVVNVLFERVGQYQEKYRQKLNSPTPALTQIPELITPTNNTTNKNSQVSVINKQTNIINGDTIYSSVEDKPQHSPLMQKQYNYS